VTSDEEPELGTSSPDEREAEDDDLASSLRGLSMLPTGDLPLKEVLTRIARFAVQAIPKADGAGLTLIEHRQTDTIVTTADFVSDVDGVQYSIGEGPCISAARDGVTVVSGSLGGDARWPRFGGRIARMGVHSALSLPLITPDGVVGAMNIYAHAKHVFDERAAALGELFAVPAAVAVQNARVLADTKRLAERLQNALDERMVVERAVGIVMSRSGVDETEALARLTKLSQHEHVKLVQIARTLVEEAVRRARATPTDQG
jgi:GAF domain-containing protein